MLLLLAAAVLGGGCASYHNSLTMQSLTLRRDYTQNFSQAYSALSDNGDYLIVLVHDVGGEKVANTGQVLQPAPVSPRQIMIIRIYWIPDHGTKLDHPVASNASVGWYVFGDRLDESAELLKYTGAGLVLVSENGGLASVTIRAASLWRHDRSAGALLAQWRYRRGRGPRSSERTDSGSQRRRRPRRLACAAGSFQLNRNGHDSYT